MVCLSHFEFPDGDREFDFMLNLRSINDGINIRREVLFEEYLDAKYAKFQMKSLDDYEQLKKVNAARSKTQSKYVRAYYQFFKQHERLFEEK